ncbi:rRNA N6-adenosine-methyltransferase ZCCHC4 isoform X2 [Ambystoma mexicanum]|uniref:rRNA N6-adenosine-methyltransferase ZCCHC4 isoform X2 n=1 Tax=Ambystoma mexicanum TaxID=8296 RepID=UPI0037E709CE
MQRPSGDQVSEATLLARKEHNQSYQPPLTHKQYMERYPIYIQLPLPKRRFCQDCQQLVLPDEWAAHSGHRLHSDISAGQLRRPSQLLYALENKKSNAQYLFADRSCQFLLDVVVALGFRRVLSVGTPRLHELIRLRALEPEGPQVRSLLLDIDFRYSQFYTDEEFCHYNMFNHHFFGGEEAREICRSFLQLDNGEGVLMVTDPPFGGLVEPLAHNFKKLIAMWKPAPEKGAFNELPIFWIFPYFFESRILNAFPNFSMLDYQVDYDNHAQYKHGKTGRKQSPVRIFTNIPQSRITLPTEEGYRFCCVCQRYVSSDNQHCEICNSCTSKDGRRWNHCVLCRKCVKPSWIHCNACNRCALQSHPCGFAKDGCFICGETDHKQRNCPSHSTKEETSKVKKKQTKKKINKLNIAMAKRKTAMQTAAAKKRKNKSKRKNHLDVKYQPT